MYENDFQSKFGAIGKFQLWLCNVWRWFWFWF